jgi:hypothetical protein
MADKPSVRVCFAYEHQYRVVDVERVWESKEGHTLITGRDPDRGGEYRSFRVDRIKGKVRIVRGSTPQTR